MSDNTISPVEGSDGSVEGLTVSPGDTHLSEAPEGLSEPPKANKEARYRVERNEARAERDALTQRVEQMQRAEVERLASDGLHQPADLFTLTGNQLADYLTESGDVDPERVAAGVAAVLAERPGLRTAVARDPSFGLGGVGSGKPASWSDLFHG